MDKSKWSSTFWESLYSHYKKCFNIETLTVKDVRGHQSNDPIQTNCWVTWSNISLGDLPKIITACSSGTAKHIFLTFSTSTPWHLKKVHSLPAVSKHPYTHCLLPTNCPTHKTDNLFSGGATASPGRHSAYQSNFWKVAPQTLLAVTIHTPLNVSLFSHLYLAVSLPLSPVSVFVWSPDPRPTGKQLPGCLSIATKLLYITAWSPAMQRGFMAGASRMVSAEPLGLAGESCAFAANKSATESLKALFWLWCNSAA